MLHALRSSLLMIPLLGLPGMAQAAEGTWSADLMAAAESLVRNGPVYLTGDVVCEIGDGHGKVTDAHDGSDARALLRVASSRRIYLFAHGFWNQNPRRTKAPPSYASNTWGGHLDAIRERGEPYSACLFILDSARGFGDQQKGVGNFLFALRALTDDRDLYDREREILLIGYSAGVNYLKQGLVLYQEHLAANGIGPTGIQPTPMIFIFLGGVHQGAVVSDLLQAGVLLYNEIGRSNEREPRTYKEASDQRWREFERSEREALATSKGATQLTLNSADLARLNRAFASAITANVRLFNMASASDWVAPPDTTRLPFVETIFVEGFSHWDFVSNPRNPKTRSLTDRIYSPDWRRTASQGQGAARR